MGSQQRLLEVFVELADTMGAEFDVIDLMHTLTEASVELLDAQAAGLMLADPRGNLQVITATSDEARDLMTLELHHSQGPGIDCFHSGQPVTNIGADVAVQRWPRFAAAAYGFTSVLALPLRLRDQVVGAMNLFLTRPGLLSVTDVALGQGLADVATIGLLQERAVKEQTILTGQLQGALTSRVVIEQAKGILAERLSVAPEEAFTVMRRFARSTSQPLSGVASRIIDGTLTLPA